MSRVECHSGYEYGERPRAFEWQGEILNVDAVLARWRSPEGKHFRVKTAGGHIFELFLDDNSGEWQIIEI